MVECFHRQLKSSLRASYDPVLVRTLIVLLGCRIVIKADLGHSSAELLYGTHLVIPGIMVGLTKATISDPSSDVIQLQSYFSNLPPISPRQQAVSVYVPLDINKWNHICVCDDSIRAPWQAP